MTTTPCYCWLVLDTRKPVVTLAQIIVTSDQTPTMLLGRIHALFHTTHGQDFSRAAAAMYEWLALEAAYSHRAWIRPFLSAAGVPADAIARGIARHRRIAASVRGH